MNFQTTNRKEITKPILNKNSMKLMKNYDKSKLYDSYKCTARHSSQRSKSAQNVFELELSAVKPEIKFENAFFKNDIERSEVKNMIDIIQFVTANTDKKP